MRRWLPLLPVLVLTACGHMAPYSERQLDYVEVYSGRVHPFQLRVPYRVTVYDPIGPRSYTSFHWIPFEGTETELSSDSSIQSVCPEGTHTLSAGLRVRGKVKLWPSGRAQVELEELTSPKGASLAWRRYRFNGEYRLVRVGGSAVPVGLAQESGSTCRAD